MQFVRLVTHLFSFGFVVFKPAGWHSVKKLGGSSANQYQSKRRAAKRHAGVGNTRVQHDSVELGTVGKGSGGEGGGGVGNSGAGDSSPCLEEWLVETVAGQRDLVEGGLCNRLDEVTSGCILVAKNSARLQDLRARVRSDDISKYYLALVAGKVYTLYNVIVL
jgi:hypothetical protein